MTIDETPHSEEVLWSGTTSHWYYLARWFFGLLVVGGIGAAVYFNQEHLQEWMPWVWAVPAVFLLILIAWIEWQRGTRKYRVTNTRLIVELGRFAKNSAEVRVKDIRSINVTKGGLSGLLGIGNIEFSSAAEDEAEVTFYRISDVDGVRDLVRKLQS
jgi:uncharacterized membrane protein YdbT with pleckstrin-like domain